MATIANSANNMEGMIESSLRLLQDLNRQIQPYEFQKCCGIVILEAVQVGFLFSAQVGTGILLRLDQETNKWSAPLAIGVTGLGAGLMMGIEKKHMVLFLAKEQVTEAMASDFSFRLGIQTSVVLIGGGDTKDITAQVSKEGNVGFTTGQHTSTLGVYCGGEADGAVLAPRTKVNEKFYGKKLKPKTIIFDGVEDMPSCEALDRLYTKLGELATPRHHGHQHATKTTNKAEASEE